MVIHYYMFATKQPFWLIECTVKTIKEKCRFTFDCDMDGGEATFLAKHILQRGLSRRWFDSNPAYSDINVVSVDKLNGDEKHLDWDPLQVTGPTYFYIFASDEPFRMIKCSAKGHEEELVLTFSGRLWKRAAEKRAIEILDLGYGHRFNFRVDSSKKTYNEDVMPYLAELKYKLRKRINTVHQAQSESGESPDPRRGLDQQLVDLIETREGLTERELSMAIFGPDGRQQNVNPTCRRLLSQGLVERRGEGGPREPYRYYPKNKHRHRRRDVSNEPVYTTSRYSKTSGTLDQQLVDLIETREGLTERELAMAIFGPDGRQQNVNPTCRRLLSQGLVERRGEGGPREPYRYYPKNKHRHR